MQRSIIEFLRCERIAERINEKFTPFEGLFLDLRVSVRLSASLHIAAAGGQARVTACTR